jgi:hypothetical protein
MTKVMTLATRHLLESCRAGPWPAAQVLGRFTEPPAAAGPALRECLYVSDQSIGGQAAIHLIVYVGHRR